MKYTLSNYYTPIPDTIGNDIPIKVAVEKMREHGYRHLPVRKGGKLVGIVSDRDIKFAASLDHASDLKIEDIMTEDPFTCSVDSDLGEVAQELADHKYGCAIVLGQNKQMIGIFTATDALKALAQILQRQ